MSALRTVSLKQGIIYGPVSSRRLGRSLGINLLGAGRKVCTFDCAYCQLRQPRQYGVDYGAGGTVCKRACARCRYVEPSPPESGAVHVLPTVGSVLDAIGEALREHCGLDSLTFSGNGEPTIHPQFAQIVDGLVPLRDALSPGAAITVLSNSSTLRRASVRNALRKVDVRVMKLDAGDEATLRRTNRPCPGVALVEIVEGLRSLGGVTVQTLLVDGEAGNTGEGQIASWLQALSCTRWTGSRRTARWRWCRASAWRRSPSSPVGARRPR